jgi:DNA-binding beta-propeller fold protein YncE
LSVWTAACRAPSGTGLSGLSVPGSIKARLNPSGIAVDQATDTIYTANIADGEHPGTASVINGATCNGTNHSGCGQAPATVAAGFGSVSVAVDPATDTVYVANIQDTSVSVINGASCNGSNTSGCGQAPAKVAVGNCPSALAVDPTVGTVYITNSDNTVSVKHG